MKKGCHKKTKKVRRRIGGTKTKSMKRPLRPSANTFISTQKLMKQTEQKNKLLNEQIQLLKEAEKRRQYTILYQEKQKQQEALREQKALREQEALKESKSQNSNQKNYTYYYRTIKRLIQEVKDDEIEDDKYTNTLSLMENGILKSSNLSKSEKNTLTKLINNNKLNH